MWAWHPEAIQNLHQPGAAQRRGVLRGHVRAEDHLQRAVSRSVVNVVTAKMVLASLASKLSGDQDAVSLTQVLGGGVRCLEPRKRALLRILLRKSIKPLNKLREKFSVRLVLDLFRSFVQVAALFGLFLLVSEPQSCRCHKFELFPHVRTTSLQQRRRTRGSAWIFFVRE